MCRWCMYRNIRCEILDFEREPEVEVLLKCKELYNSGKSMSRIRLLIENAPALEQIKTFINLSKLNNLKHKNHTWYKH